MSRQIQALESHLGVPLFRRLHRSLALTDEGRAFFQATASALGDLDRATRAVRRSDETKAVIVTTTPGFAGLWLIPRLFDLRGREPGRRRAHLGGNTLSNLERDGIDVAVRYQAIDDSSQQSRLFGETVTPVCSPKLRRAGQPRLDVPADLAAHTLLRMEHDGGHQLQDWGLWLHAMKLGELRPAGVMHFSSYDQLIQAAIAGQGIALGRLPLIERLMKSRKLIAPFAAAVVLAARLLRAGRSCIGAQARGRGPSRPGSRRQHAARIQHARRVERGLDRAHQGQGPPATCAPPSSSRFRLPTPCSAEIEPPRSPTAS